MIKGLGVDIVEIDRIKKLITNEIAIKRILTEKEIIEFNKHPKRHEYFAGRFAVKEATSKAFGVGLSKCPPCDVETINDELGAPKITLYDKAHELQTGKGVTNINVSISHEKAYAVAVVIIE